MITVFRISDALKCMMVDAPGTANLAAPTELIVRRRPLRKSTLWAQSLLRNPKRITVGDWKGIKLCSLASVRVRSGIRSWEVDRLHLNDSSQAFDLLEEVVSSAGHEGAERVFLRVPVRSEIAERAREVGFFPYFDEVHLTRSGPSQNAKANGFSVGQRTQPDLQGLFQLYNAVTPPEIRQGIGMTIDQWKDSQEPVQGHRDESILKSNGKVVGWLTCDFFGNTTSGQTLVHHEHPDLTRYLIDISDRTYNWLIPNYQPHVSELLAQQGLHESGRYVMLIKKVTVPVSNREFSYVEA